MSAPETGEEVVARAIEAARRAGAAQADAVLVEDSSLEARVRGEVIEFVKQANERCLGIRALVRQRAGQGLSTAVTSTSDLSAHEVERLAEQTVALAHATAADPSAGLPEEESAADWPDLELAEQGDRHVAVEARIEDARRAEQAARETDPRIVNSEGSQVGSTFARIVYGNTRGFLGGYDAASHSLFSEPIAREAGDDAMQRSYWMTVGRRLSALDDPASVGRQAANRALRRLGARRVATCEVPVIFDDVTAPGLVGQLAGCVSGYSVYRQSSFLADKMDESIAAENVRIVDDGRLPAGLGSKPFDGEGLPTRRNVLVEAGRLKSWLLDSYSARKLGLASTASAARGAGSGPSVGATNLWLEPCESGASSSFDQIIADTKRGLLVTELIGMGFNAVTGDYSRGAAGLWIEDGEIAFPVEEITIAGHFGDMLQGVDRIGNELHWHSRVASPALRIANMTVGGE